MALTVDKIIKGFNKTVAQLEEYADLCSDKITNSQNSISIAEANIETSQVERKRANSIASKLRDLLN